MSQTFSIDLNGASPFQVFDSLGNTMFDARYAALKVAQIGAVNIPANTALSTDVTTAYADIMLTRVRSGGAPLYVVSGLAGGMYTNFNHRYVLPSLSYFSSFLFGYWTTSYSDRLRIGNQSVDFHFQTTDIPGAMTAYYVIFDNSVST